MSAWSSPRPRRHARHRGRALRRDRRHAGRPGALRRTGSLRHRPDQAPGRSTQPRRPSWPTGILVAFDDDTAGRKAAVRAYGILRAFSDRLQSVALSGTDPAEILETEGGTTLSAILRDGAQPLSAVVIDAHIAPWERRLQDLEGPLLAMRSVATIIADLLPWETAEAIRRITQNKQLTTLDEYMQHVSNPSSQISPACCQPTPFAECPVGDAKPGWLCLVVDLPGFSLILSAAHARRPDSGSVNAVVPGRVQPVAWLSAGGKQMYDLSAVLLLRNRPTHSFLVARPWAAQ